MRRAFLPLIVLASLVAPLGATAARLDETYTLVQKYALGDAQTVTMKIDGKFADVNFVSETDMSQKVTEVTEDGGYTIETTTGQTKTTVNGTEMPMDTDDSDASKVVSRKYDAKGKEVKAASAEEEEDNGPLDIAFEYEPKAPVKVGETWTPEKEEGKPAPLEWTLTGKEEFKGKEALVLVGKGKGPNDEKVESKVWLDPVTFVGRKATTSITGIKSDDGAEGEMTVTVEEKA